MPVPSPAPSPPPSRRERLRAQTLAEIRGHALDQVETGGADALSLTGIARAMGMSGPAMYRYYASREDLLAALVTDGYAELTRAVEGAAAAAADQPAAGRLRAVCHAYRAWALGQPRRYALLFGPRPAGFTDPGPAVARLHGSMLVLLSLLAETAPEPVQPLETAGGGELGGQLTAWAVRRSTAPPPPPHLLRLGVHVWTLLHGLVSLEIAGAFGEMGLDGRLLLDRELDQLGGPGGRSVSGH